MSDNVAQKAFIQIVGTPVACAGGYKDSWRTTAEWAAQKLTERYGDAVTLEYYDLFDPSCPPLPEHAQIPVILIDGSCFSVGSKISIPAICRHLESLGVHPLSH